MDRESASAVMVGLVLDPDQAEGIVRALEAVARALTLHVADRGATKDERPVKARKFNAGPEA